MAARGAREGLWLEQGLRDGTHAACIVTSKTRICARLEIRTGRRAVQAKCRLAGLTSMLDAARAATAQLNFT